VPELELKDELYEGNYGICIPGFEPFPIEQVSDSYASLINIYSELAMRSVLLNGAVDLELPPIVLIDELEAHLDVAMQKRIFSMLTQVFPNAQFFIATNSPFIITALENCTVFDVGMKKILIQPSEFQYNIFMQYYYDIGPNSQVLVNYFSRYKELALKENSTSLESDEFKVISGKLEKISSVYFEHSTNFKRYEQLLYESRKS
jgi:hypothetical protein